jgi:hypothetical protein
MKYTQPIGTEENSGYVDFNAANGTEGSVVPAAAIEHPQREIINVITAAGFTPDEGKLDQLVLAINKLIANAVGTGKAELYSAPGSRAEDLAINANFTVPAYKVGSNALSVYWNGLMLANNQQYQEQGTTGASSTTIKLLFALKKTAKFHVKVG